MSIKFPNMKRFFSLFLAAVMMVTLLAVNAHAANTNKITDYGDAYGHWAYEALTWAVDNGVLVGTSEDKLNPDGYLTRAQMAAMIDQLFGTYKSVDISRYTDVSRGSWYYDYIAQAVHMGTFAGYSNRRMGPNDNITREQAIVVLARTVCLPSAGNSALARFPDRNQVGAWAADSVAAMIERGYVSGYNDGRLNPKGQITRAEMAQIMCNIFQSVHNSGEITDTAEDVKLTTENLGSNEVAWTVLRDGKEIMPPFDLTAKGGHGFFPEPGFYTFTASVTDELGRVTAASDSIQIYPVGVSGFYLPKMFHTDSVVTLVTGFEELGENSLRWSLTRNGENGRDLRLPGQHLWSPAQYYPCGAGYHPGAVL